MSVCVHDSPETHMRECWSNGRLIVAIAAQWLFDGGSQIPPDKFFFGANIGVWKMGQVVGDPDAMPKKTSNCPELLDSCRKCGGAMVRGQAIENTWRGTPEWPGDTLVTMSPGGPGKLVDCRKCSSCGWSVS